MNWEFFLYISQLCVNNKQYTTDSKYIIQKIKLKKELQ